MKLPKYSILIKSPPQAKKILRFLFKTSENSAISKCTLHLRSARRIVELHFRLAAALVMKPQHYATCLRDHESGQWIHFDGMVPWEDLGGVPSGRGSVIDAPRCASDVGGQFWSMLLYERVVAPA